MENTLETKELLVVPNNMYIQEELVTNTAYQRFDSLKERIERYWFDKGNPIPQVLQNLTKPAAFLTRHVAVANEESKVFIHLANKMDLQPVWSQYLKDQFYTVSSRKMRLLYLLNSVGQKVRLVKNPDIFNGMRLEDVSITINGNEMKMVDYHQTLWKEKIQTIDRSAICYDMSDWLQWFGKARDYYFGEMTLLLSHGVMFKDFHSGVNSQSFKTGFTDEIVLPAIQQVQDEFGLNPMIYQFKQDVYFPYMLD
ncbi:hypothetical protein KC866_02815 [Patescibacteria group bacterium]|nr:hypothetical protein [Patescibacteria group bacterium]